MHLLTKWTPCSTITYLFYLPRSFIDSFKSLHCIIPYFPEMDRFGHYFAIPQLISITYCSIKRNKTIFFLKVEFSGNSYKEIQPKAIEHGHGLLQTGSRWTSQAGLQQGCVSFRESHRRPRDSDRLSQGEAPTCTCHDSLGFLKNVSILRGETYVFTPPYIYTPTGRSDWDSGNTRESCISHARVQSKAMLLVLLSV